MRKPLIGVLALQGAVRPHFAHLEALGCEPREVRLAKDFDGLQGLILPGGESTTLLKLLKLFSLDETLVQTASKIPYWGICAGSILMATTVENPSQRSFSLMDIGVRRNAYGRQNESFNHLLETKIGSGSVSFIRAPQIIAAGSGVTMIAQHAEQPIWLEQGRHMVTTFHAELSPAPSFVHRYFVEKVKAS